MNLEDLRVLLYPFGFLSSIAFGTRFLVQWYASEKSHQSVVPKAFWKISFTGNFLLFVHTLIQIQFPMCLLQSLHMVLAWRNLNLMKSRPMALKSVFILLAASATATTCLFILQGVIFNPEYMWIRPTLATKTSVPVVAPWWIHFIGILGVSAFSLRFWIQWWQAEVHKKSYLSPLFWRISLTGALLAISYFIYIHDWVNLVGPLIAVIPYIRNLQLISRKERQCAQAAHIDTSPTLFIITCETSADQLGANVVNRLKERHPEWKFKGITGPYLRNAGVETIFEMEQLRVMGLSHVLKKLPTILRCLKRVTNIILQTPNASVICIDSPSFSLRLAKKLRKKGFGKISQPTENSSNNFNGKIIQYVAPSVWAYKEERAEVCARYWDLLLTLYRFEPQYFAQTNLKTIWTGHPIVDRIEPNHRSTSDLIALFPGSRPLEIQKNLTIHLKALQIAFKEIGPRPIAISLAPGLDQADRKTIEFLINKFDIDAELVDESLRFDLMKKAHFALAKSGTVTLELALSKTPTIVTYPLSLLNYLFAKWVLRPHINKFALPNIISKKEIFPEYISRNVHPNEVARAIIKISQDDYYRERMMLDMQHIHEALKVSGRKAEDIAAEAIEEYFV